MAILSRGERFKEARVTYNQHNKQTMKEVETATGVSASLIQALEDDENTRSVGYDKVALLAKHYGVTSDWLLCLTEDPATKPCAADELGLSTNTVKAVKSIGALEDAGDILAGLNIILEGCNMVFISRETKKLREKIQAECAYTDSQLNKAASRHSVPLSSSQSLLIQDMDLSDSLICELQDAHPELKDRLFSIFCGQTAIDMAFQTIAESFTTELKKATGYFDYIAKTMGNK